MSEIILVSATGQDRPGLSAALTEVMVPYGVQVLDIGQAVIHDTLAWRMVIEVPDEAISSALFKELVFRAHDIGMNVRFSPITKADYSHWAAEKGQPRHIITILGRGLEVAHVQRIAQVTAQWGLNIERIERLSGRQALVARDERRSAVEFVVRGKVSDLGLMRRECLQIAQDLAVDVAVQEDNIFRRHRRLICFDMDSTLIPLEMMDEMARVAGVGQRVKALTDAAMRGEIGFRESFIKRLRLLKGLEFSAMEAIARTLPITEGAERLIVNLRRLGFRIAIISGGFQYVAEILQRRLAIDEVFAHKLEIIHGRLTGDIVGDVIDGERKAFLLNQLVEREGLRLEQVIAVGDGANDLPMLSMAGLGIAFHAKPLVHAQARHAIATLGLDGILYLLGMRERDIEDSGSD